MLTVMEWIREAVEIHKEKFTFRADLKIGFRKCWKNEGVKGLEGLMLGSILETQRESRNEEEKK